ncbi:MAG: acyl carrier protein [Solirubrobacteraceae bacterium]|jgi:acyl carrier protein
MPGFAHQDPPAGQAHGIQLVRARPLAQMTSRDEVFALIQAHLADELDVEPSAISEQTRFKEDLEADSLDLYTLVQELEDTYGVSMSDDQAARILAVGQAVDFVLAHDGVNDGER